MYIYTYIRTYMYAGLVWGLQIKAKNTSRAPFQREALMNAFGSVRASSYIFPSIRMGELI